MLHTLFFATIALVSIAAGLAMVTKHERWCRRLGVSKAAETPVLPGLTLLMGVVIAALVVFRVLNEPNALG